jgi:hypothetical protein
MHSLWHEIIGFIFLVFALVGTGSLIRNYATLSPWALVPILPLIILSAGYGVSSFLKARRISRS